MKRTAKIAVLFIFISIVKINKNVISSLFEMLKISYSIIHSKMHKYTLIFTKYSFKRRKFSKKSTIIYKM